MRRGGVKILNVAGCLRFTDLFYPSILNCISHYNFSKHITFSKHIYILVKKDIIFGLIARAMCVKSHNDLQFVME